MTIGQLIEKGTISLDTVVRGGAAITADGVWVAAGAVCYSAESRSDPHSEKQDGIVARIPIGSNGRNQYHIAEYTGMGRGIPSYRKVSECYSTREAAEAARSKA